MTKDSSTSDDPIEILERTTPFQGYFRVDRYRLRHRKFEGGWTGIIQREVFERGHAAVVLPYDPVEDRVVLIEQFRIGALAAGREPWLIETVAGIIEPGEAAADLVRREAHEEAGCEINELEEIGTFFPTPGGSSETLALFVGRTDSRGLGGVHGLDSEDEDIRVLVPRFEEALTWLAEGRILNLNAVVPLQWLALNKARLREKWLGPASA